MKKTLIIVHDVLGTLFDLSSPIDIIKRTFHDQLGPDQVIRDRYAELIVMDWYHAAQRDFSFLSLNRAYTPIGTVFRACLPRVLLQAGLVPPPGSSSSSVSSAEEVEQTRKRLSAPGGQNGDRAVDAFDSVTQEVMASLQSLKPRPGMREAFEQTYRSHLSSFEGVHLWGATNGSLSLAENLFGNAVPSLEAQQSATGVGLWSCDEIQVAKPDPRVYAEVKRRVLAKAGGRKEDDCLLVFVASHSWDLDAAKRAGFHTAWVSYEEFSPASGIYLEPDLRAATLVESAQGILEWAKKQ